MAGSPQSTQHERKTCQEGSHHRGRMPIGCQLDEDLTHLLFLCPHTSFLWRKFKIQNMQGLRSVQDSITNPRLVQPAQRVEWAAIFIAIAWNIWLTRNRKAFDNVVMPARTMGANCWYTISLWAKTTIIDWTMAGHPADH
jgi:hypothetical protein